MNYKGVKTFFILSIVFVVPVVGYLLLRTGTNHYKRLPIYGEKSVSTKVVNGKTTVDTIYHTIDDFSLVNQQGEMTTQNNFKDAVYVADFFFVSCPTICPKMSTQMSRLQDKFKEVDDVRFVSYTVNPEADSVPVLAQYAKKYRAELPKWYLLTGDKKEIYGLARKSYLVNALQGDGGPDDFIHSELFVLVDKNKRIRGYYDGTSVGAVDTLIDEIKVLMKEELSKNNN